MKVKLEQVTREEKTSKAGKSYTAMGLKFNGVWHNGFGNKSNSTWKEGDTVEVEVYEEEYNGKMYKKFKTPTVEDMLLKRVEALEAVVFKDKTVKDIAVEERSKIDVSDLPFK